MPIKENKSGNFSNQENNYLNNNNQKSQKVASAFLVIFGLFVIVFSFSQIKGKITGPFVVDEEGQTEISSEEKINFHFAVLQNMDTDNDTLSDYDELYTYDTSPYLEDTDSDGLTDLQEIQRGSDPNCPEGQDCSISGNIQASASSTDSFTDIYDEKETETPVIGNDIEESLVETLSGGEVNTEVLRQIMLANGFSQEDLDQISDEELTQIYIESINSQSQNIE